MLRFFTTPLWVASLLLMLCGATLYRTAQASAGFTPALQPVGYVAQHELTGYDLQSKTETIFRVLYEKSSWSGNVLAYRVDGTLAVAPSPGFDAAALLDARADARMVVTMHSDGSKVPFAFNALSSTQQHALDRSYAPTGRASAQQVLGYLRGDRSLERNAMSDAGALRVRGSRLGDIVHSRPLYVADAALPTGLAKTVTAPLPTLFVGSNDGMLHAFDASVGTATSGQERWAYVPSMLLPKLSSIADPDYRHDYFVDGSVNAGYVLSGARRILVGALGAGGRGLFALDITGNSGLAPPTEAVAASHILWEITDSTINNASNASYANLGYSYANPILGSVNGTDAVIVGNGYLGADGRAYLYVINALTGTLIGQPIATDKQTGNGLSTPAAVDADGDGNLDYVFAGDLLGRMWRFDLHAGSSQLLYDTASKPPQPITTAPAVARHPNGGYMVNFATGSMLRPGDSTDANTVNAAYGIWDGAPATNKDMLTHVLATRCFAFDGATCRQRVRTVATVQTPDWRAGRTRGWMTPLPAGERVVGDGSFIENSRFYFNAYNPSFHTLPATDASVVFGSNYLMELDYLSGGIAKNQPFLDLNGDGQLSDADRLVWHVGDPTTTPATREGEPILTADGVPVGKFISVGVMSQPVMVHLPVLNDTLFNQNPEAGRAPLIVERGISGGHFDVASFFNSPQKRWSGCTAGDCSYQTHVHAYDDIYDVTGVNFLDASDPALDLAGAIPSPATPFKVLVQNQYLSPATFIHIGDPTYIASVDAGYSAIRSYQTDPGMTAATLLSTHAPTFTRATIGSFVVNMPRNALDTKDWWGATNGLPTDVRAGLHVTDPACVNTAHGSADGNLYRPVIPPPHGRVTATGNGIRGYDPSAPDNTGALGVRHNGALTIQLIRFDTPASALEPVALGSPEYGWTLKRGQFSHYVLAEYSIYGHASRGAQLRCFGDAGWTKVAAKDVRPCGATDSANQKKCATSRSALNGTDPYIDGGDGGSNGAVVAKAVLPIANGSKNTITYTNGHTLAPIKSPNASRGASSVTASGRAASARPMQEVVPVQGSSQSGGLEGGLLPKTGRISWTELVQP